MIKYHLTKNHTAQLLTLLAAALLTVGCTAEGEGDELVEIAPTMTINGMNVSTTRAATDDGEAFYFSRCDETGVGTGVFGSYPSTAENILEATRNSSTGALTFKKPQYYYTNGRKCRFIGFYPQQTIISSYNIVWEIDGTTDVFIATRLEGSKTDKGISTFNFKHRLTQLQFFPFAETADIAAQWGKITKIEILDQPSSMFWYYLDGGDASGRIAFSGYLDMTVAGITDAAPFTLPTGGKASATVQAGASTMTGPRTDAAYVLSLRITTEKLGVKTVTRTGTLLENTPYRIYLRFIGQAIELAGFEQLNIEDWQDGYPKEVNSGRTYPYVVGGNTIVSKDADGQGANDIHANWTTLPFHTDWYAEASQVPAKLQIEEKDAGAFDATTAVTKCSSPWRLPTLQELRVMREMQDLLIATNRLNGEYYTGTAWHSNPNSGSRYSIDASGGEHTYVATTVRNVRCVKDVE